MMAAFFPSISNVLAAISPGGFALDQLQPRSDSGRPAHREFGNRRIRNREAGKSALLGKRQLISGRAEVDLNDVSQTNLACRYQIGYGVNQMALNRAFEMSSAIFKVCALTQQELFRLGCASKDELPIRLRGHDAVLNLI